MFFALQKILAMEQAELELALSCDKVRFPVEGLRHCLSHTTIGLQSVLSTESIGDWCLPQLSSETLHPVTDGNRCDNKYPSIGCHSGKPPEEREKGMYDPRGQGHSTESTNLGFHRS